MDGYTPRWWEVVLVVLGLLVAGLIGEMLFEAITGSGR